MDYPDRSLSYAASKSIPPAPSSPAPAHAAFPQSESPKSLLNEAGIVLPSPSPSVETRPHNAQVLDLENEAYDNQTPEAPFATRLEELVARYGGFEQLEKRLENAERLSHEPSPWARTQSEEKAPDPGGSEGITDQDRPQSLDPQLNPVSTDVEVSFTVTPHKRTQGNSNEPRKRTTSGFDSSRTAPGQQHPSPIIRPVNYTSRSPPRSDAEMRLYSQAILHRLENKLNQDERRGSNVERPRLELLRDACERSDYFYLCLHQIFCLDYRCRSVPDLTDVHRNGLNVLSYLLVSNQQLTPEAIQWFSIFPLPVELYEKKPSFRTAQSKVMRCLELLGCNWDVIRSQCTLRRYPPLVDELVVHFNVMSLTFQSVIFTAILRDIWTLPQDHCYHAAEKVFPRNFREVMTRRNPPIQAIQAYNQSVIEEYERILSSHTRHLQHNETTAMAPPQHGRFTSLAASNVQNHRRRSLSSRHPEIFGSPPPELNVHAAQRDTRISSSGSVSRPTSALASQTALVGAGSSATQSTYTSPYQLSSATGLSAPESASLAPSPTHIQGFQSPDLLNNPSIFGGVPQHGRLPSNTAGNIPHNGAPARRAPQILPSNAPRTAHPRPHHPQQGLIDGQPQQNLYAQSTTPHSRAFFINAQPAAQNLVSRSPHSPAPFLDQFIRSDPSRLPSQPDPTASAFHQAHVRSPVLSSVDVEGKPRSISKYFRLVSHVIMPTTTISSYNRHVSWDFTTQKGLIDLLAQDSPGLYGSPATREIAPESKICRIRCIRVDKLPTESEWVIAENVWPGSTAVVLNGIALEIRKKSHHGKDLPIDATRFIKEGKNHISTAIIGFDKDSQASYAIGIEIIQVANEHQLKNSIPTLAGHEARQCIIDRSMQVDPEVQVIHSQMIIDLTDPFTARIFYVPVRGSNCRHNQCFDRDVFFQTRNSKNSDEPCGPDEFRCPICGADARPKCLIIDGFFVSVREELERKGRLDVKRIILDQAGDWEIKEEEEATGEQGDGTGRRASVARQSSPVDVIEIDDD